jgi:hypothetical protein
MKKVLFRFFAIYFFLIISPLESFYRIPGVNYLTDLTFQLDLLIINFFNKYFLHVKDELNFMGYGSGDTSYAWARFYTYMILAGIGCVIWSIVDRKRKNYDIASFWLRNFVRYYVASIAFIYAFVKLFALQMPFPNLSQLATPLGDFLPMRLSWMFIGYSAPYQMFSGAMELIVAFLLLNRRTVSLGAFIGVGVFANVFILNLSYDIPVKLYSMQLLIMCVYLMAEDWQRFYNFFAVNKVAEPSLLYDHSYNKKWQRIGRVIFKIGFIILFAALPFYEYLERYNQVKATSDVKPIKSGVYDIETFILNGDTTAVAQNDFAWKDFIFDKGGAGSIATQDTLFRPRYRRGYFTYVPDTTKQLIGFRKFPTDTLNTFELRYQMFNDSTFALWGKVRSDSVYYKLVRGRRHFQLTEKQFHWISEANR